jgi:hypothetical protein
MRASLRWGRSASVHQSDRNDCPRMGLFNLRLRPQPQTAVLDRDLEPVVTAPVQNPIPTEAPKTPAPRRRQRRRPAKVVRLYRQAPPEPTVAEIHVQHLIKVLTEASDDHPELKRRWIPKADLEKFYAEIAEAKCWQPQSWTAMGKALAKVASRRRSKIQGRNRTCYRIPKTP